MFERYTEKARRAIFFARYEASQYGNHEIDTEHLLLGLIRENKAILRWLPKSTPEKIRTRIDECTAKQPRTSTAVDLPLSSSARLVLKHAADEADLLAHRHIGTEHLFLGVLDEPASFAAELMVEAGADAETVRSQIAGMIDEQPAALKETFIDSLQHKPQVIRIHGIARNAAIVRQLIERCRYNWHWHKQAWTNIDIAVEKKTGKVSFDLKLAQDSENFELVKGGWKKDHCFICRWELFESQAENDVEHAIGYTNGHLWLCTECYTKFWERPDFFASPYSDIT
jgi:hypothetical protein